MSETCQNPICKNQIDPLSDNGERVWRRTSRRFCSDQCKSDTWVLKQAAKLLLQLGVATGWEILQGLLEGSAFDLRKNGDGQDKAQSEIVDPKTI